jgi:hypothetical protein
MDEKIKNIKHSLYYNSTCEDGDDIILLRHNDVLIEYADMIISMSNEIQDLRKRITELERERGWIRKNVVYK